MKSRNLILVVAALLLAAVPASAELYTITFSNGTVLESRQRPMESGWDENMIMVLTDVGNWIGVDRSHIVSVTVETERAGFGKVIDVHTVALGWAPNDAPAEDPDAALDPTSRLLDFLQGQADNRQDFSVQQFVEPGAAGGSTGGLPVGGYRGVGDTAFPVGGGGSAAEPEAIDN